MPIIRKRQTINKEITLDKFHERKNKVLIYRSYGGLGDILMHRMMFEDIKKTHSEMEITFACPPQYIECVKDHPYLDRAIDCNSVQQEDYGIVYNTTNPCSRYESAKAPYADKHRSDIWANYMGVELTNHNMHINLTEQELSFGKEWINKNKNKDGPNIFFSPISAMASKNLLPHHIEAIAKHLKDKFVYSVHTKPIEELEKHKIPVIFGKKIREWMSIIAASDYVISVDSAAVHFAGGINKPVCGIFTWADGYVYTKYYKNVEIVQLHRNTNPKWTCGPCYAWTNCPKTNKGLKPCLTELTTEMIIKGIDKLCHK